MKFLRKKKIQVKKWKNYKIKEGLLNELNFQEYTKKKVKV